MTAALAEHIELAGKRIWEPAAGNGDTAEALRAAGARVLATDIADNGYRRLQRLLDFTAPLPPWPQPDGTVTNPPGGARNQLAVRFVELGLERIGDRGFPGAAPAQRFRLRGHAPAPVRRMRGLRHQDRADQAHRLVRGAGREIRGESFLVCLAPPRARATADHPVYAMSARRQDLFPSLRGQGMIAVDCETNDPGLKKSGPGYHRDGFIAGVAVGTEAGFRAYYPIGHAGEGNLDKAKVLGWLKAELSDPAVPKVGTNLVYDLGFLKEAGSTFAGRSMMFSLPSR